MYLVKQAAALSGLSVRTLHHYDRIGLLKPKKAANGYRCYDDADLNTLQQICFYKYLGFRLQDIHRLLGQAPRDNLAILQSQLALLKREQTRLLTLINTLEQSIAALQGDMTMTAQEKFAGFTYDDYLAHIHEKYDCCAEQVLAKQQGREAAMMNGFNDVFFRLAQCRQNGDAPSADAPQQAVQALYELLSGYACDCPCTPETLAEVAESYVDNATFRHGLEQFGTGTAQYARDAVRHYVANHIRQAPGKDVSTCCNTQPCCDTEACC